MLAKFSYDDVQLGLTISRRIFAKVVEMQRDDSMEEDRESIKFECDPAYLWFFQRSIIFADG